MDLPDDIFTPILSFANGENEVKSTNRIESIANTAEITMSPIERALKEELAKRKADQWVEENRTAIRSYNEFVEQHEVALHRQA